MLTALLLWICAQNLKLLLFVPIDELLLLLLLLERPLLGEPLGYSFISGTGRLNMISFEYWRHMMYRRPRGGAARGNHRSGCSTFSCTTPKATAIRQRALQAAPAPP